MFYYENNLLKQNDFITGQGACLGLTKFYNRNTSKIDEGGMLVSISYVNPDEQRYTDHPNLMTPPLISVQNEATITSEKYPNGDSIYSVSDNNGLSAGGAGTNYLMGAFPISEYGLHLGDVIEFSLGIETGSKIFHHECVDVVLDCGYKAVETIRYTLGADTYEKLGSAENPVSQRK